jgi:adenylate cyclase
VAEERVQRRLAAILAADVVGYSHLMGVDEAGTRQRFNSHLHELIEPTIANRSGRIVKTTGDGLLVEFGSVIDAVECAVEIQSGMAERNADEPDDRRIAFRIGVNLGDVIIEGDDIHGDGVNIAARLEGLAKPGGLCVSGKVVEEVRNKLDVSFEDMGEQNVKNIDRPVQCYRVGLGSAGANEAPPPLSDIPAVAVLPFENMSGDPEQEYFADGLTEDIITALSLWRSFPVIARNSTFAYKGQSPDVREAGKALGARYVVEGSVRKAGNRVRITVQLIDAGTGHHVWAERYDRELEDIFAVQDEITQRIAAIIQPAMEGSETKRVALKPPSDLNAWDLCIQGYSLLYQGTRETNQRAREKFHQAIALEPNYARCWTGLAYTHNRDIRMRYAESREKSLEKSLEAARRAVALDETDSVAHVMLSRAFSVNGQKENALAEARRAIELNPQDALATWSLGTYLYFDGHAEEGIPWIEKALDLNPLDPLNYVVKTHLAAAKICAGDHEQAAELARDAIRQRPDYLDSHVALATALSYLGRTDDAQQAIGEFHDKAWDYVESHPLWGQETKDVFRAGLRKAGLVE